MEKNYNVYRRPLYMPEYGRHIHKMIDDLMAIQDSDERNRCAKVVIDVMGNLNPMLRDTPDFTHKLWDHLFVMSDFKLDVASPYPIPSRRELAPIPRHLSYPEDHISQKYYGKTVQKMVRVLEKEPDKAAVEIVIANLARYMRTKSYEYNQEHPSNEVIIKDIKHMSENGISMNEDALNHIKSEYKQPQMTHPKRVIKGKKNLKQGKMPMRRVKK